MGIRRACSYQATIQTPEPPDTYSAILVTFQQDGVNLISKNLEDLEYTDIAVIVKLNQEETKQFVIRKPAYLQIRCFASEYNAPGSAAWPLDIKPALDDTILGGGS